MTQVVVLIEQVITRPTILIKIILDDIRVTPLETIDNLSVGKSSSRHSFLFFSEDNKNFSTLLNFFLKNFFKDIKEGINSFYYKPFKTVKTWKRKYSI